jgi:hypothetical protein
MLFISSTGVPACEPFILENDAILLQDYSKKLSESGRTHCYVVYRYMQVGKIQTRHAVSLQIIFWATGNVKLRHFLIGWGSNVAIAPPSF